MVSLVDLEEGPRLAANLIDVHEDEVAIGLPAEVSFLPLSEEIGLPVFRPLTTGSRSGNGYGRRLDAGPGGGIQQGSEHFANA